MLELQETASWFLEIENEDGDSRRGSYKVEKGN